MVLRHTEMDIGSDKFRVNYKAVKLESRRIADRIMSLLSIHFFLWKMKMSVYLQDQSSHNI